MLAEREPHTLLEHTAERLAQAPRVVERHVAVIHQLFDLRFQAKRKRARGVLVAAARRGIVVEDELACGPLCCTRAREQ